MPSASDWLFQPGQIAQGPESFPRSLGSDQPLFFKRQDSGPTNLCLASWNDHLQATGFCKVVMWKKGLVNIVTILVAGSLYRCAFSLKTLSLTSFFYFPRGVFFWPPTSDREQILRQVP